MPKPKTATGEKNLIGQRLIELRREHHMSQRLLAYQLQLNGYDMDKNVITRIETNKRYVTVSRPRQHRHLKRKNSILFLVFLDFPHFFIHSGWQDTLF